jgi:hypothetical protein
MHDVVAPKACEDDVAVEEADSWSVCSDPELSHRARRVLVARFFTDMPKGSNSMEKELSVVNRQIVRRF